MFLRFLRQAKPLISAPRFYAGRKKYTGSKSLYETLGVDTNADQSTIKKAYYKLAQQYHPDKNSASDAKQKFAEINNAYEILSDESKKKMYDQTGSTNSDFDGGMGGAGGMDYQEFFRHFAGNAGGFQGGFGNGNQQFDPSIFEDFAGMFTGGMGGGGKNYKSPPVDIVINLDVDFKDSVFGGQKDVRYFHRVVCSGCNGSKAKPGTKPKKCNTCHGKGSTDYRQGGFMFKMVCGTCNGQGNVIRDFCTRCKGQGIQQKQSIHKVYIPKGVSNGATIKAAGKGSCNQNLQCGDLIIKVSVKPNIKFKREGFDVISSLGVSLADAVLGTQANVQTIYGQTKTIIIPQGTQNGDKIRLSNQGFEKNNRGSQRGIHYVTVNVDIPKKISSRQRQLFEELRSIRSKA